MVAVVETTITTTRMKKNTYVVVENTMTTTRMRKKHVIVVIRLKIASVIDKIANYNLIGRDFLGLC
jgi:uncharacterized membrane protein YcgQ (UPF0703/DUF1980 family)